MFLGYNALRRYCAVRNQGTCTPKNAIDKTRYLGEVFRHPRGFRTRSSPDMALPRPPVDRMTSNRGKKPRTDVPQIRDQNFRPPNFIIPRIFSERVLLRPKRAFLTFRGTCGPQEDPTGTWECSHWIRHRILHNSMCSGVT